MRCRQDRTSTPAAERQEPRLWNFPSQRFDELIAAAAATAPSHHLVDIDDVGELAAFLVSDRTRHITGTIIPVDGGQHLT